MVPTSLPEGKPSGIVWVSPSSPCDAMRSILGVWAYSSGVLFPNSATGQSAMPSPCNTTYFMICSLTLVQCVRFIACALRVLYDGWLITRESHYRATEGSEPFAIKRVKRVSHKLIYFCVALTPG